jgi:hypothetical protein
MPATIGEFFYKRGGRVATELNHAHGPIVATLVAWWPWKGRNEEEVQRAITCVIDDLTGEDGALVRLTSPWHPPAWRSKADGFEGDLTLVCVFDDLCAGYRAVGEVVAAHRGRVHVQIAELHRGMDPFAALWPCSPVSKTRRYDVWLDEHARKAPQLRSQLAAAFGVGKWDIDDVLDGPAEVAFRALFEPVARRVAAVLEARGSHFELRDVT